ncbi:MAG: TRAP transporter large permease subunit, partial [Pygmaiobacter sp.]
MSNEIKDVDVVEDTAAIDVEIGTAADVEEMMKKFDRESNVRNYTGVPKKIIRYSLCAFTVFMISMNLFATWDERIRRCLFLGFVFLLVFAVFPAKKGTSRVNHIPVYDIALALVGSGSFFYYIWNFKSIVNRATRINELEIILGVVGILVLVEACRRVVGLPIIFVASAFVIYAFASGSSLKKVIYNLFYTTTGVIGTPVGVCSTYIVLFIVFGAFLEATGIADFFIQCANSVAGGATGGPAKVSVISSALCGMV